MNVTATQNTRNYVIDVVKGALILCVIVGHLFDELVTENSVKWFFYSFHIPVFLGISGFVFNREKAQKQNIIDFAKTAFVNYGLPWLIASCIFLLIISNGQPTLVDCIKCAIKPWYHLWYIPVYFLLCLASKIWQVSAAKQALIALFVFTVSRLTLYNPEFAISQVKYLALLGDSRLYTLGFFYFLGSFLRNNSRLRDNLNSQKAFAILFLCAVISIISNQILFHYYDYYLSVLTCLAINTCIIMLLPAATSLFKDNAHSSMSLLIAKIGKNSLFFYLWHPLPLLLCKKLIYGDHPTYIEYVFTLLCTLASIFAASSVISRFTKLSPILGIRS